MGGIVHGRGPQGRLLIGGGRGRRGKVRHGDLRGQGPSAGEEVKS